MLLTEYIGMTEQGRTGWNMETNGPGQTIVSLHFPGDSRTASPVWAGSQICAGGVITHGSGTDS